METFLQYCSMDEGSTPRMLGQYITMAFGISNLLLKKWAAHDSITGISRNRILFGLLRMERFHKSFDHIITNKHNKNIIGRGNNRRRWNDDPEKAPRDENLSLMPLLVVDEKEQSSSIEIEEEIGVVEDNPVLLDDAAYCPSWIYPKQLGTLKISSGVKIMVALTMIGLLITFFILTVIPDSPVIAFITDTLEWIEGIKLRYQIAAMFIFFLFSAPLGLPVTILNLASGFLFGFTLGVTVALIGAMAGSIGCYIWGKTLLKKWAFEQMQKRRTLEALGIAVQKKAVFIIALTHLSPILPATLLHYTFAAVGVSFFSFGLGTFLGILPFVVVYVFIGSKSKNLTDALSGDGESSLMEEFGGMVVIVLVSALILVIVTWIARRELNKALKELDQVEQQTEEEESEETTAELAECEEVGERAKEEIMMISSVSTPALSNLDPIEIEIIASVEAEERVDDVHTIKESVEEEEKEEEEEEETEIQEEEEYGVPCTTEDPAVTPVEVNEGSEEVIVESEEMKDNCSPVEEEFIEIEL